MIDSTQSSIEDRAVSSAARSYWLDLFTGTTWQHFMDAGGEVSGFRESRWAAVQRIKVGDYLLCYLTGISRFIGVLEVTSAPFKDSTPIWKEETFPCRVGVTVVVALSPATGVPIHDLRDDLTIFQNLQSPLAWTGHVRGSPQKWKNSDGQAVIQAVSAAQNAPIERPVDAAKLARRPNSMKANGRSVTIPGSEVEEVPEQGVLITGITPPLGRNETESAAPERSQGSLETTAHTEVQWLLLKLGNDMGLSVWVASNDRGREADGQKFNGLPKLVDKLPLQFDAATNRTIELIDVLWLQGSTIVAAFEVESTTSIYSGLLRMSDLITMQPNLNIPLYLVAPDDRRGKVIEQVNRPTFAGLTRPMSQMCRYIPFSTLRNYLQQYAAIVRHLKPDFLNDLCESCEAEDA